MLRVVTPATERSLIAVADLRAAVSGFTGTDAELTKIAVRASDMIARACGVAAGGPAAPTLRLERVRDTVRSWCGPEIALRRRFAGVASIKADGVTVSTDLIEVDFGTGAGFMLPGAPSRADILVVEYDAGFAEAPQDLQEAVILTVREMLSASDRDPLLRSETIDDLGRFDYQVGGSGRDSQSALPCAVRALIAPYRSVWG